MPTTRGQKKPQPLGRKQKAPSTQNKKKIPVRNQQEPPGVGSAGSTAQALDDPDEWLTRLTDHLPSLSNPKPGEWLAGTWDSPSTSGIETRQQHSPSRSAGTRRALSPQVSAASRSPAGSPHHNKSLTSSQPHFSINEQTANETSPPPEERPPSASAAESLSSNRETNPSDNNVIPEDPTADLLLEMRRQYHRDFSTMVTAEHHLNFLKTCAEENIIPKGLKLNFSPQIFQSKNTNVNNNIQQIIDHAQKAILAAILEHFVELLEKHMNVMKSSPSYEDLLNIQSENLSTLELQQHSAILRKTHHNVLKKKDHLSESAEKKLNFLRNKDTINTQNSNNKQGRNTSRGRTGQHKASSTITGSRANTRYHTNQRDLHQTHRQRTYHKTPNARQPYRKRQTQISQFFPTTSNNFDQMQPLPTFPAQPPIMHPPWMMGMYPFSQFPLPPPNPSVQL